MIIDIYVWRVQVGHDCFIRIIKVIFAKQYIDPAVMESLAERFEAPGGPPRKCNYKRFIRAIDVDSANTAGLSQSSPLKEIPTRRREMMAGSRTVSATSLGEQSLLKRLSKFITC